MFDRSRSSLELGFQVHDNEPSSSKLFPYVGSSTVQDSYIDKELEFTIPPYHSNAEDKTDDIHFSRAFRKVDEQLHEVPNGLPDVSLHK
ncbi:hypothetical protein Tco_0843583 [Tanacetum coccineum]|uniref:Uncharacterized protein n=1 Tax=Tanacetum coccineum TaxID=301880 RepID=A0ABQ5B6L5_9ASTR